MKVTVQEKIAELESRIAELERGAEFHTGFAPQTCIEIKAPIEPFGEEWRKLWAQFETVMKTSWQGRKP